MAEAALAAAAVAALVSGCESVAEVASARSTTLPPGLQLQPSGQALALTMSQQQRPDVVSDWISSTGHGHV